MFYGKILLMYKKYNLRIKFIKTYICLTVRRELEETGHFECMDLNTDEEEHSIEMQLPFIAKVMEGYV